jgi:hypothetical protein
VELVVESEVPGRRLTVFRDGELVDSRWRLTDSTSWELHSSWATGVHILELSAVDGSVIGRGTLVVDGPGPYVVRVIP